MKKIKKRIALAFYAVVLLATLYVLFGMRHFDGAGFEDEILRMSEHDHHYMNAVPTATVPDSHSLNTHRAGRDQ
jgi:hypothetical protein